MSVCVGCNAAFMDLDRNRAFVAVAHILAGSCGAPGCVGISIGDSSAWGRRASNISRERVCQQRPASPRWPHGCQHGDSITCGCSPLLERVFGCEHARVGLRTHSACYRMCPFVIAPPPCYRNVCLAITMLSRAFPRDNSVIAGLPRAITLLSRGFPAR